MFSFHSCVLFPTRRWSIVLDVRRLFTRIIDYYDNLSLMLSLLLLSSRLVLVIPT